MYYDVSYKKKEKQKKWDKHSGDIWFFSRAFFKSQFEHDESQERTKLSHRPLIDTSTHPASGKKYSITYSILKKKLKLQEKHIINSMEYAFSSNDSINNTIFEKKQTNSVERTKNLINTILIIVYMHFLLYLSSIREEEEKR